MICFSWQQDDTLSGKSGPAAFSSILVLPWDAAADRHRKPERAQAIKTRRRVERKVLEIPENIRFHLARKPRCDSGTFGEDHSRSPAILRGYASKVVLKVSVEDLISKLTQEAGGRDRTAKI